MEESLLECSDWVSIDEWTEDNIDDDQQLNNLSKESSQAPKKKIVDSSTTTKPCETKVNALSPKKVAEGLKTTASAGTQKIHSGSCKSSINSKSSSQSNINLLISEKSSKLIHKKDDIFCKSSTNINNKFNAEKSKRTDQKSAGSSNFITAPSFKAIKKTSSTRNFEVLEKKIYKDKVINVSSTSVISVNKSSQLDRNISSSQRGKSDTVNKINFNNDSSLEKKQNETSKIPSVSKSEIEEKIEATKVSSTSMPNVKNNNAIKDKKDDAKLNLSPLKIKKLSSNAIAQKPKAGSKVKPKSNFKQSATKKKEESQPTSSTDVLKEQLSRQVMLIKPQTQHCDSSSDLRINLLNVNHNENESLKHSPDLHEECSCGATIDSENLKYVKITVANQYYNPQNKSSKKSIDLNDVKIIRRKNEGLKPMFDQCVKSDRSCPVHDQKRLVTIIKETDHKFHQKKANKRSSLPASAKSTKRESNFKANKRKLSVSLSDYETRSKQKKKNSFKISHDYNHMSSVKPVDFDHKIDSDLRYSLSRSPFSDCKSHCSDGPPISSNKSDDLRLRLQRNNMKNFSNHSSTSNLSSPHKLGDSSSKQGDSHKCQQNPYNLTQTSDELDLSVNHFKDQDLRFENINQHQQNLWSTGQWCIGDEQPVTVVMNSNSRYNKP